MTNSFSFYQGIWKLIQAPPAMEIDVFQASKMMPEKEKPHHSPSHRHL